MSGDLDSLRSKIDKARHDAQAGESSGREVSPDAANMSAGMRTASEFLGSLFSGILLGYLVDTYLGLAPLGIIMLPLAGLVLGAYRANKTLNNNNNKK